ncbi:MAG: SMR family transporter [Anaerolineae bacterium]|jgi:drug/metabolite transporter (DMT)-like permease
MIALLVATLFSAAFGLVLRWAQQRRCNVFAVGFVNYLIATLYQVVRQVSAGPPPQVTPITLWLGAIVGAIYALNFGIFSPLIAKRGVSITTAIVRLAVIVPIVGAIVWWHETPLPIQYAGILLTLVAMPLITLKPNVSGALESSAVPLLAAMFLGNGVSMLLFQAYQKLALPGEDALFLACLFGAAMLVTLVAWRLRSAGSSRRDIIPGVVLGLTNALANAALLESMHQLPSVIVFPFYSAVGLVVAVVAARLLWGERISQRETLGLGLAIVAVALVNMA